MAEGYVDRASAKPGYNVLPCCLPANRRAHWGCATARKETKDADRPSNQLALPILVAFFMLMVVCIIIPFSEAVKLCALLPSCPTFGTSSMPVCWQPNIFVPYLPIAWIPTLILRKQSEGS